MFVNNDRTYRNFVLGEIESYGPRPNILMLASVRIPLAVCKMKTMKM